ncbi:YdeI/OmpD-associated family protein [Streptomyces sp. NPDC006197]|uniref:YdeI/OmpD-associated family protein n=1 Tax=Streptomyces sp. NPDC006197 TaxID=3156685 RepID=UPI0033B0321B
METVEGLAAAEPGAAEAFGTLSRTDHRLMILVLWQARAAKSRAGRLERAVPAPAAGEPPRKV